MQLSKIYPVHFTGKRGGQFTIALDVHVRNGHPRPAQSRTSVIDYTDTDWGGLNHDQ